MRYLNRLRLKHGSLVNDRKETGKSLYDFAMDRLILMPLNGLSLKISLQPWISAITTYEQNYSQIFRNNGKWKFTKIEYQKTIILIISLIL